MVALVDGWEQDVIIYGETRNEIDLIEESILYVKLCTKKVKPKRCVPHMKRSCLIHCIPFGSDNLM